MLLLQDMNFKKNALSFNHIEFIALVILYICNVFFFYSTDCGIGTSENQFEVTCVLQSVLEYMGLGGHFDVFFGSRSTNVWWNKTSGKDHIHPEHCFLLYPYTGDSVCEPVLGALRQNHRKTGEWRNIRLLLLYFTFYFKPIVKWSGLRFKIEFTT